MRAVPAWLTLASIAVYTAVAPSFCGAQVRVGSVEELRTTLAPGDVVTIVPESGEPLHGRLMRIDDRMLDLRRLDLPGPSTARRDVSLPLGAIRTLERPRDPVRNGTLWGMGIGAGTGAALFIHALVIDRNEIDEWASGYAVGTAALTGLGALIGWAIDTSRSKPSIAYASPPAHISFRLRPPAPRRGGVALAVSFAP